MSVARHWTELTDGPNKPAFGLSARSQYRDSLKNLNGTGRIALRERNLLVVSRRIREMSLSQILVAPGRAQLHRALLCTLSALAKTMTEDLVVWFGERCA
jgi:hypothetical protein